MGCQFGKPPAVAVPVEEPEGDMTGFSDTQIDTIRSTWPLLSGDNTRVGVDVFIRIFTEAPSIHALFSHFNMKTVEDMRRSKVFQAHAVRFMLVIQNLVDHLETPQDVDQQLLILGAKHATFDGYHPEYFRFYSKCMMDVWETELGEEFISEVRDSWRLAFDYIVERMTEGFDMCLSGQIQDLLHSSMTPPSTSLNNKRMSAVSGGGGGGETGGGEQHNGTGNRHNGDAGRSGGGGVRNGDDGLVTVQ